ncbi:MAG: DNA internalization-related competence protein ComEC/Rec2 [Burkholderiaceae bacterium]|nr:DNA internalization-related competence protein ComEC/Rec2 [Burkholderiaceae bacterium]
MTGRLTLLAFVAATAVVHRLLAMPGPEAWMLGSLALLVVSMLVFLLASRYRWRILLPLLAGALGLVMTITRVEHRLADVLAPDNENKVSRVVLRIAELPRLAPDSRHFQADVISSKPEGVPTRIQVSWAAAQWSGPYGNTNKPAADFPELIPGQVWRMSLTLKPPHGLRNPNAFDYEAYAFAQGIRATGSVRGTPVYLYDQPWANLGVVAQRARHYVRRAMLPYVQDKRYGAVLLALSIGDQASVDAADWLVFNRTGITHLVSISGTHITLIAALGGSLMAWLWRRLRFRGRLLAEYLPAQIVGAWSALLIAWLYCLLAGWGVPARRTFLMLAVLAVAYVVRLPLNATRLLLLAAFAVVILDPWALISAGFWLSFGAVGILMACAGWQGYAVDQPAVTARHRRWTQPVLVATRLQLIISAGLMPLLALLFHEVSLISPVANAYAIPLVSLVVTPVSLLLATFALVPGLEILAAGAVWLGHGVLHAMMVPTQWLGQLDAASVSVAAAPVVATALGLAGLVWALMPYGLPGRHLAWLLMMPALFWQPKRPAIGDWDLYALDVGQASAIVVRTAGHTVLFDTGVRSSPSSDSGARVVWPFLRSLGIRSLDVMVVSHADIDHAGGMRSVLDAMHVQQAYASFDIPAYLAREARLMGQPDLSVNLPLALESCRYGQQWRIDNVDFEFLWSAQAGTLGAGRKAAKKNSKNDQGCVLKISGQHHTALLPGDIGEKSEHALVERGLSPVDVVLASHHGSKTSSSAALVGAVQAQHVIAQVGAWSRYGHPHATIEGRWRSAGAQFWRSDQHGAVHIASSKQGLVVQAERQVNRRYWQHY